MIKQNFHVEQAFACPVIVDHLPGAADINPVLETAIEARRARDPVGLARTNQGGWHSGLDALEWGGAALRAVADHAVMLADANTADIRSDRGPPHWSLTAWANISEPGAWNRPHAHGGCFWSAIYYVRVDPGQGGELVLHDPRMPMLEMHAPNLRFVDCGGERQINAAPTAGRMILLPSWLIHSVNPWQGPGKRISIAINLRAGRGAGSDRPVAGDEGVA